MFKIEAYKEEFKKAFDTDVKLEKLGSGFRFIEGPVWNPYEEYYLFSDIMGNALYKWQEGKGISLYRANSYLANGNTFDKSGNLITCEHGTSRISKTDKEGNYEVIVSKYNGKELNSPNDVICSLNSKIYFTDPNPGRCPRVGIPREQELSFQGVYMYDEEKEKLVLLDDTFEKPNGLCLSKDEKKLYVNDSAKQHIRVFDVLEDGTIAKGKIFAELVTDGPGVADGMKINTQNMFFCSGPRGIQVFDLEGSLIGRIYTPEVAANFTWGGKDMKDLFLTASSSVYRIKGNIEGFKLF